MKASWTAGAVALSTLRFPGHFYQAKSGLHQNGMRDYDPTTGRYIEADPLGVLASVSLYGYAGQNPANWTDANGEQSISLPGGNIAPLPVGPMSVRPGTPLGDALGQSLNRDVLPIVDSILRYCATSIVTPLGDGTCGDKCSNPSSNTVYSRPKNPPDVGPPNGWVQGSRRGRQYDSEGNPQYDIDEPHQGYNEPHVHEWPGGDSRRAWKASVTLAAPRLKPMISIPEDLSIFIESKLLVIQLDESGEKASFRFLSVTGGAFTLELTGVQKLLISDVRQQNVVEQFTHWLAGDDEAGIKSAIFFLATGTSEKDCSPDLRILADRLFEKIRIEKLEVLEITAIYGAQILAIFESMRIVKYICIQK